MTSIFTRAPRDPHVTYGRPRAQSVNEPGLGQSSEDELDEEFDDEFDEDDDEFDEDDDDWEDEYDEEFDELDDD